MALLTTTTTWREPGGEHDENDPKLQLPQETTVVSAGNSAYWAARKGHAGDVSDVEIEWMAEQRELTLSEEQLTRD